MRMNLGASLNSSTIIFFCLNLYPQALHLFILLFLWLLLNCSVISYSLELHGLQLARLPCHSLSPRDCSNSCPLSQWCHPTSSSSVTLFSSCLQSFPAPGCFPVSQLFSSDSQSIGVSASVPVLPMNIQGWCPLGQTGLISLLSKGLSRVFSKTTAQKHQFFDSQPSLRSNSQYKITQLLYWCWNFSIILWSWDQNHFN